MTNSRDNVFLQVTFGLSLLVGGCSVTGPTATEVDASQIDGVWVFAYAEEPDSYDDALGTGRAGVVDDCLLMGEAVVVWRDHHLSDVDEVIAGVLDGESIDLKVGGGGLSLEEGSTSDDFPSVVLEHCSPIEVWFAGDGALEIEEGA